MKRENKALLAGLVLSSSAFASENENPDSVHDPDSFFSGSEVTTSFSGYFLRETLTLPNTGGQKVVFNALPLIQADITISPRGSEWSHGLSFSVEEVNTNFDSINIDKSGLVPGNLTYSLKNDSTLIEVGRIDDLLSPYSVGWNAFVNGIPTIEAEERSFFDAGYLDVWALRASHDIDLGGDNLSFHAVAFYEDKWNPVYFQDYKLLDSGLGLSAMGSVAWNTKFKDVAVSLAGEFALANYDSGHDEYRTSFYITGSGKAGEVDWMVKMEGHSYENRFGNDGENGVTSTVYGQIQGPLTDGYDWHVAGSVSKGEFEDRDWQIAPQIGVSIDLCNIFKICGESGENSLQLVGAAGPTYYPETGESTVSTTFGLTYNF